MIRSLAMALMLTVMVAGPDVVAQTGANPETFKGTHRNERVNGRPETVTVTDGQSYVQLTEEEYRAGGYRPAYDALPTRIARRVPVRKSIPADQD
ncbi:hypothetical protein [Bradyrhizobium stylosanthis]|uniref:Uncharacterized protein n=1 Tax=Bradyrhizobium stylosanthis TaxID=1803665 RepID=A0A560D5D6_9BRAD|nr:hypothetical protein [Bradyrhizobium stylosanthis]TWA92291.1 hypothetical protein FBZ96_11184 [Bradyrhizobium stylosanthis]